MRILCLTARLPYPPDRGDRLRAFHILRTLAGEHELTLLSFTEGPHQRAHVAELESLCGEVRVVERSRAVSVMSAVAGSWRRLPLQVLYYRSRAMRSLVAETVRERAFDAAYVHLFRMAPYLGRGELSYRIVDLTDLISVEIARSLPYRPLPSRALYTAERRRIDRYERQVAASGDEVWVISEGERSAVLERCPSAEVAVIPNGVDGNSFRPIAGVEESELLMLTGHMGVFHNLDAARDLVERVLPVVRGRVPGCRVRLAGADPCRAVRRLADRPGVEVTGWVPDLNLELNRAAVFVAPLRVHAGVQNKVLEAMAAGRPVVTTTGVAGAIGAVSGRDLLAASDVGEVAEHTMALLADPDRRRRLGAAGRAFVCERFSWGRAALRVREIAERIAARS